jgi:hypothetical protein
VSIDAFSASPSRLLLVGDPRDPLFFLSFRLRRAHD